MESSESESTVIVTIAVVLALLICVVGGLYMLQPSHPATSEPAEQAAITSPIAGFSREEIDLAALRLVHPRVPYVYRSYLGGTLSDVTRAEAVLANLRQEFSNYDPPEMRRYVLKWLDYFAQDLAKTKVDIETQQTKREQDAYHQEREAESARADQLIRQLKGSQQ